MKMSGSLGSNQNLSGFSCSVSSPVSFIGGRIFKFVDTKIPLLVQERDSLRY